MRFGQDVLCGMFAIDIASSSLKLRCMIELMTSLHTVNFAFLTFWYVFEELSYVLCTPLYGRGVATIHSQHEVPTEDEEVGTVQNCRGYFKLIIKVLKKLLDYWDVQLRGNLTPDLPAGHLHPLRHWGIQSQSEPMILKIDACYY